AIPGRGSLRPHHSSSCQNHDNRARYNHVLRIHTLILLLLISVSSSAQQVQPGPVQPMQGQRDTIVVTGTYEPLTIEEIDRAVRVLPVRTQSLVFNTLGDVLKLDPSLDFRERAPNGVQGDLSIRGSTFGQTLILLNGLRLNDA